MRRDLAAALEHELMCTRSAPLYGVSEQMG